MSWDEAAARFYVAITPDTEVEVVVTARDYNGVDSDPKVISRKPTFCELRRFQVALNRGDMRLVPHLDFPVQEMKRRQAEGGGE